jgi:hypothetical protein
MNTEPGVIAYVTERPTRLELIPFDWKPGGPQLPLTDTAYLVFADSRLQLARFAAMRDAWVRLEDGVQLRDVSHFFPVVHMLPGELVGPVKLAIMTWTRENFGRPGVVKVGERIGREIVAYAHHTAEQRLQAWKVIEAGRPCLYYGVELELVADGDPDYFEIVEKVPA